MLSQHQIYRLNNIYDKLNNNFQDYNGFKINENIGGNNYKGIYLIDVVNHQVISHILFEKIVAISAIIKLNKESILIGCQEENKSEGEDISYAYSLIEYKYNFNKKTLTKVKEKTVDIH